MLFQGIDLDAYAEGLASLAHWPDARADVLRRLAVSEARWEAAAAGFRAALVEEAGRGRDDLARQLKARFEIVRDRLSRERPSIEAVAPIGLRDAEVAAPQAEGTAEVDRAAVAAAVAASAKAAASSSRNAGMGTVEIRAPGPFVPNALPFAVDDDAIEAYAALTADLASYPERRARVLEKHGVENDEALEHQHATWQARFRDDLRMKMAWEGLHRGFSGFVERQRARGRDPWP